MNTENKTKTPSERIAERAATTRQLRWEIATAMKMFGGSFVEHLGELWFYGDEDNRAIIESSWAHYWEEYFNMVENLRVERGPNWWEGERPLNY